MKLNSKVSLLTGIVALSGAIYMPQANAVLAPAFVGLGELSPASATTFSDVNLVGGSTVSDIFSFTVGSDYALSGSLSFTVTSDAYSLSQSAFPTPTASSGLDLASVQIVNANSLGLIARGVFSSVSESSSLYTINLGPTTIYDNRTTTLDTFSFNNAPLLAGYAYLLEVSGIALGQSAVIDGYSGSLSVTPYGNLSVVSAVPVPSAVWLFGSGLGLLSLVRRGKRNG